MQKILTHLAQDPLIAGLAVVTIGLLLHFLWQYVLRGFRLRAKLKKLSHSIRGLQGESREELRGQLQRLFEKSGLEHAWGEYADTLHEQYDYQEGRRRFRDIRATVPAEAFINLDTTVDPRIGAEYFKHLPGLFTGLGIVGTFNGLIRGLMGFSPNVETEQLKEQLSQLFGHVQGAFLFSAVAIGLAMVVTFVEKWLYASCSKWLGEITAGLDKLFRAGVGEEYLSGLLQASQDNATQTRQLKESMVEDLKVLLTNLTERQVQATQQLSADLGQHITNSLKEPLAAIADTVRQVSGEQTTAASHVLENLMTAFMAQMRDSLGGQMGELSALMSQTAQSISSVEASMRTLVNDLQRTSRESNAGMQSTVQSLIESMRTYQQEQSRVQADSTAGLLERVEAAMVSLAEHQQAMARRTEESTQNVVGAMGARVDAIAKANEQSTEAVRQAVTSLGEVSTDAIEGMSKGAAALSQAVAGVHSATERLAQLADRMASLQSNVLASADKLTRSTEILGGASQSLATTTTTMSSAATRLEAVAKSAMNEAESRAGLLSDLKAMSVESRTVGQQLASLSGEVQEHLANNIEAFGGSVSKVLSQHLATYQKELGDAVQMLMSALEGLAEVAVDAKRR